MIEWFDNKGLVVPEPHVKYEPDDFLLQKIALNKEEECISISLQRSTDKSWLHITCWHNELIVSVYNAKVKRTFVKVHEVYESYAEAYEYWKEMSMTAARFPSTATNLYKDELNFWTEKFNEEQLISMHPNWNTYIQIPLSWSHDLDYWRELRNK